MNLPHSRGVIITTAMTLATAVVAIPAAATGVGPDDDNTATVRSAVDNRRARSVILLIGDGMGDSEITMTRNYQAGAAGRLALDTLPLTGAITTYSVQRAQPTRPDYVPDSASAGTAIATGHKTYDGAISVLPDGRPVPSILELAKRAGYRTGDVSTAELQDATPAVFASHVSDRDCKGPQTMAACPADAKENGGAGSISEQLIAAGVDVLLGGGRASFDQITQATPNPGRTVLQQAAVTGYTVVTDAASLAAVKPRHDGQQPKVLGSFAAGNLAPEWTGPVATAAGTAPARCASNGARPSDQPHLADMTRKAIELLDSATRHSRRGFFLHVEGASIDKQAHAGNPCGQIGETVGFDAAVRTALDYQRVHPDTLIIVTADHGHTAQIVEAGSKVAGVSASLTTRDDATMTVSYGTAPVGASQQHTGTQLRVAAKGPRAGSVLGVSDSTRLFTTMATALGLHS